MMIAVEGRPGNEKSRTPFFLYIDDFNRYYDGSFKLSKSREKKNKVKNYLNTLEDKNNDKFKKITNLPK